MHHFRTNVTNKDIPYYRIWDLGLKVLGKIGTFLGPFLDLSGAFVVIFMKRKKKKCNKSKKCVVATLLNSKYISRYERAREYQRYVHDTCIVYVQIVIAVP